MTLKTHLLHRIANADLSTVLDELDAMLLHGKSYHEFATYKPRYRALRAKSRKGTIKSDEETLQTNQLTDDLIEFIQSLDEHELLHQILLLSPDKDSHDRLAPQFKRNFPNAAEEYGGRYRPGDFAFVVCNDFYTQPDQQAAFDALMEQYLQAGHYLVCYTPDNRKAIVGNNRDKAHAANSPFALYARIREMIDFVRYFKP